MLSLVYYIHVMALAIALYISSQWWKMECIGNELWTNYADPPPPLPKASYIILYYPRSEVCGLQSHGFIHTVACNYGLFSDLEIFVPTGQQHDIWLHDCIVYLCQQNSFMLAISSLGIQGINELCSVVAFMAY